MNTKYLVILCLFLAITGACSKDQDNEAIEKLGTPLPNESKYGKNYYLLPVFAGKDAYYGVYYPVEGDRDTCKLGDPLYVNKTCTKEELFSLSFGVGKKDWEETEPRTIVIESWE